MTSAGYDETLSCYLEVVRDYDDLKVKGKAMPYTSMNGNMFSFLDKEGTLCLRMSDDDRKAFVQRHNALQVIQYGAVMRGYVPLPPAITQDAAALRHEFKKCYANARTLKPKPTTKKKP